MANYVGVNPAKEDIKPTMEEWQRSLIIAFQVMAAHRAWARDPKKFGERGEWDTRAVALIRELADARFFNVEKFPNRPSRDDEEETDDE